MDRTNEEGYEATNGPKFLQNGAAAFQKALKPATPKLIAVRAEKVAYLKMFVHKQRSYSKLCATPRYPLSHEITFNLVQALSFYYHVQLTNCRMLKSCAICHDAISVYIYVKLQCRPKMLKQLHFITCDISAFLTPFFYHFPAFSFSKFTNVSLLSLHCVVLNVSLKLIIITFCAQMDP